MSRMRLPVGASDHARVPPPAPVPTTITSKCWLVEIAPPAPRGPGPPDDRPPGRPVSVMGHRGTGSDRDPEHLGHRRVAETILHLRDGLLLAGAAVRGLLARRLVGTHARLLVDLGARVPQ